jgi:hypothetical protein
MFECREIGVSGISSDLPSLTCALGSLQQRMAKSFAVHQGKHEVTFDDSLIGSTFTNGGPVAVVYGFIVTFFGILSINASLAEMASM